MSIAPPEHGSGLYRVVAHLGFVEVELLGAELPEEVGGALMDAAITDGWSRVLLNCSRVQHLSSLGLGSLIRLDKHLRPGGGRLRLCGLRPDLRDLFAITRVDRVLRICDHRDEAILLPW